MKGSLIYSRVKVLSNVFLSYKNTTVQINVFIKENYVPTNIFYTNRLKLTTKQMSS